MKILFIGTVEFSHHMLETLSCLDVDIVGVIAGEDTGRNSDYVDLEPLCKKKRISCLVTKILEMPRLGIVGFHPAELPKNRGRHPLIWSLALGLKQTGSTFFFMDEGADSGNIINQKIVKITSSDDARSLYTKIIKIAEKQIKEVIHSLSVPNFIGIPQDHSLTNTWRKRNKLDGQIDWRMAASEIYNLVRALSKPYVGAHVQIKEKEFKIWKVRIVRREDIENIEPGKVIFLDEKDSPLVVCGEDAIELIDVEPELKLNEGEYL